jgi:hypothetical protein
MTTNRRAGALAADSPVLRNGCIDEKHWPLEVLM